MNPFLLILRNDWLRLTRGKALKILAGLALLSGLYALIYGQTFVSRQRATIAQLKLDERTRLDSLVTWARLDTSMAGNKQKWATATSAYEVNVPEGYRFAVHDPSALAPLSLGMRDLFPYYQDVWGRAIYRQVFQQEINNPQKLSVGHFDWAFVVIFLLPLLLITLSYNLLSAENELGTYSLLRSQPVTLRQIVLAKLALRLLLVLGFLVGITALAVPVLVINGAENGEAPPGGLLAKFLLVSVAYGLFWGAVIFAVVSFQKSSAFNALALLGCWLVLVVVLPTLLQQILTISLPIDRTTFENMVRDEYSQEQPDSVVLKPYYARHQTYYFPRDTTRRDPDLRAYYARNEQVDLTLAPLVGQYETAMSAREATVSRWNWLLPAVNALELFNGLSGTSAAAHRDYIRQIRDFHGRWNAFFLPKVFKNELLTPADYTRFPAWSFQSTAPGFAIGEGLLKLLLGTLVLLGLGWWRLAR